MLSVVNAISFGNLSYSFFSFKSAEFHSYLCPVSQLAV